MLRHGACITLSESPLEIGGALFLSLLRVKDDLVLAKTGYLKIQHAIFIKMKFNGVSVEKGSRNSVD